MTPRTNFLTQLSLAWSLAWNDCLIRFRSGVTLVFVILLPLFMVLLTGLAFQGFEPGRYRVVVALEDNDGGPAAKRVRQILGEWPGPADETRTPLRFLTETLRPEEARRLLRERQLTGILVLPAGLSANLAAGRETQMELVTQPGDAPELALLVPAVDHLVAQLREERPRPLSWERKEEGENPRLVTGFSSFAQAVAGNGVMFVLFNCLLIGGMSIFRERQQHTLDRLLMSPLSTGMVFLGKVMGVYVLGLVQAAVIFGFGAAVGVPFGSVVGVVLITMLFILVGCALALTISAISDRQETIADIGSAVSLFMSALGGGMFPLQFAPAWMQKVALLFPTGWAMQGYQELMWEGKGLLAVVPHLAVLAGFAAVFFLLGIRALRRLSN